MHKILFGTKGMSLIGAMVTTGVVALGAASLSSLFLDKLKDEQQISMQQGAELAKRTLTAVIVHERAWEQTVNSDASLACLRKANEGTICSPTASSYFVLRSADGSVIADASAGSTKGFDKFGSICNDFSPTGNDNCPFQFRLRWSCEGGTCPATSFPVIGNVAAEPKVVISAELVYKPKSKGREMTLKTDNYAFSLKRQFEARDLSSTCRSVGGYYDAARKHCSVVRPEVAVKCNPVTQYLGGISSDGTPICLQKKIIGQGCPNRNAIVGIDASGSLLCGKF